jgi:methylated-DNA-[protein]-cysteine S-methyltransferase
MINYLEYDSPLGNLLLAATERGICGLYFEEHRHFKGSAGWRHNPQQPDLQMAGRQLDEYFDGRRKIFNLPLDLTGTPFQRAVWQALAEIPFGAVVSYAQHAARVARPNAVRAVGTAIGRNPVSIIVPCHRVLGSSGALTGYAGGLERKRSLLALEGRDASLLIAT